MVKNSKYLLSTIALLCSIMAEAQMKDSFDAMKRDSEITRVTLENHLKNWNDGQLLNKIQNTSVSYESGKGLLIKIEAPNSEIYLSNGVNWSFNTDNELLDTFYDDDMIMLQQSRLSKSIAKFIADFHTYLPSIKADETYSFYFDVKDEQKKNESTQESPMAHKRQYQMDIQFNAEELNAIEKLNEEEILQILKIDIKTL